MKSPFVPFAIFATLFVLVILQTVSYASPRTCPPATVQPANLIETARGVGELDIFVAALQATGLDPLFEHEGPFTLFVPSDSAFARLTSTTLESLLKRPEALAEVLAYHVVLGHVSGTDVARATSVPTLYGEPLTLRSEGEALFVDGGRVVRTDVSASNGVIHVIDRVALPAHGRTASL